MESDLPVANSFVEAVQRLSPTMKLRTRSKWLNAISITIESCDQNLVARIAEVQESIFLFSDPGFSSDLTSPNQLPFVESIRVVASARRYVPAISSDSIPLPDPTDMRRAASSGLNYGQAAPFLSMMQVPELHQRGLTGANVTVAILDSGFNITHPAVSSLNIQAMYDFVSSALALQSPTDLRGDQICAESLTRL